PKLVGEIDRVGRVARGIVALADPYEPAIEGGSLPADAACTLDEEIDALAELDDAGSHNDDAVGRKPGRAQELADRVSACVPAPATRGLQLGHPAPALRDDGEGPALPILVFRPRIVARQRRRVDDLPRPERSLAKCACGPRVGGELVCQREGRDEATGERRQHASRLDAVHDGKLDANAGGQPLDELLAQLARSHRLRQRDGDGAYFAARSHERAGAEGEDDDVVAAAQLREDVVAENGSPRPGGLVIDDEDG